MDTAERILVVDDDAEIRQLLTEYLHKNGFPTRAVADGKGMRAALETERFDLVVLDLMLPGEDGLSLCRTLRVDSNLPVIMLTARGEETDRIIGLEMGADDYLAKPFNPRELLARIKSVLRRYHSAPGKGGDAKAYCFAGWRLDTLMRNLVSPEGVVTSLSGAQYQLLTILLTHPGRVLSRDQVMLLARGHEADPLDRAIDLQVSRLRQRLRDDPADPRIIKTVRGEGYVLAVPVEAER